LCCVTKAQTAFVERCVVPLSLDRKLEMKQPKNVKTPLDT